MLGYAHFYRRKKMATRGDAGTGIPYLILSLPLGGKVDCRSYNEGKTDEGSGYNERNV